MEYSALAPSLLLLSRLAVLLLLSLLALSLEPVALPVLLGLLLLPSSAANDGKGGDEGDE